MKKKHFDFWIKILFLITLTTVYSQSKGQNYGVEFGGDTFNFEQDSSIHVTLSEPLSAEVVSAFYARMNAGIYKPLINSLLAFKKQHQLNDWLYYQLIRKTAQSLSPKADNYSRYTLYKWFLLAKSGYDARVGIGKDRILFYILNDEDISDIPFFMNDGKKYMCLNYHDYGKIDFEKDKIFPVDIPVAEARKPFSYKVTHLPDFKPENYAEKDLEFSYRHKVYHFKVKLNPEVENLFTNYPGVGFESYFNIPLSSETYSSLIPLLTKNTKGMSQKKGVDYLMRFTRYAFLYENDEESFGKEKRLSPEQTLFYAYSDCDDRAALFFYLVKEVFNLPMIALLYPTHITMAVQFDKPVGSPIVYKGNTYTVCEPTPQSQDLRIGQLADSYKHLAYKVVYQYDPLKRAPQPENTY
ncbi:MAG: hypothetical protein ACOH2A_05115 [Sphingobacteriaceae bacterium]